MKKVIHFILGLLFGIILIKSEVVSWFRIQEMFRLQSFHMYGVIGSAVVVGMISVLIIKKYKIRTLSGSEVDLTPKPLMKTANFAGGAIFGLGWAFTGACPGPVYSLIGYGYISFVVVLIAAYLGTYVYGLLRSRLPH